MTGVKLCYHLISANYLIILYLNGTFNYIIILCLDNRKLLQKSAPKIKVNAVVAKDGSGKYKSIKAALKAAPEKSKKRYVIYVKKGIYKENVRIEKTKWNIMIIGDGKDATIVSGNRNFIDGTPTFKSATFGKYLNALKNSLVQNVIIPT